MRTLEILIKGLWIGATLTVPGVSGGSMAMVLGVYEPLIVAFNNLLKKDGIKKESLRLLLTFTLGGMIGIIAISGLMVRLLDNHPLSMAFLFAGVVLGGIRIVLNEIDRNFLKSSDVIYPLIGIALVLSIATLPRDLISFDQSNLFQFILQIGAGIVAAIALILPGISISQMLYVLGMYSLIMEKVSRFDLFPLIPFAIGLLLGIISTTKVLGDLLNRFRKESYLVTSGFVVGSVIQLMKNVEFSGFGVHCIILSIIGFSSVFFISKKNQG